MGSWAGRRSALLGAGLSSACCSCCCILAFCSVPISTHRAGWSQHTSVLFSSYDSWLPSRCGVKQCGGRTCDAFCKESCSSWRGGIRSRGIHLGGEGDLQADTVCVNGKLSADFNGISIGPCSCVQPWACAQHTFSSGLHQNQERGERFCGWEHPKGSSGMREMQP